jgi:subtilisin-like proprotein convertase family protein
LVNASAVNTNTLGSYVVTYNVSDAVSNVAMTVSRMVNVIIQTDTTPPLITLLGANPIEILEGGTYSEPGYSAADNVDGNITANVSVNASSINATVVGSYSVTYNVSDIAGNGAATVTRSVNVVSVTSTQTANPTLSVGAASVSTTLTITDDRQIADLDVFIDMPHAYPGDVSIILTSPSGTSVTIVDGPGKPASRWGCATDDFLVTLDDEGNGNVEDACASPPAISGSLIPNNALSAFDGESSQGTWTLRLDDSYTQADTGTLNSWSLIITAEVVVTAGPTEDTTAPILNLVGNAVIDHQNGDTFTDPGATANDNVNGNITANISVSGGVDVNTDGTYVLTYSVQDAAGNAATPVTRTINVSSISALFAEAETGTIGGNHNIVSNHLGFTGSGFVDYAGEGYMEYTFDGSAVPYDLTIRYALGGGNRPLEVILNGATLGTINFPATGTWTTWLTTAPFVITPNSGANTLRLQTTGSSGANVDSFTLTPQ